MLSGLVYFLLKATLLPPGLFVLIIAVALLSRRRWPRISRTSITIAAAGLYILGMPFVSNAMLKSIEVSNEPLPGAEAIVVLGAGITILEDARGGPNLDRLSLERVVGAARVARETGLPILASGGVLDEAAPSVSSLMAQTLHRDFQLDVRWTEERSGTTADNAIESARILRPQGVRRIVLVTHAWHLWRARLAFEGAGFTVVPYGVGFANRAQLSLSQLLPSADGMLNSYYAVHELLGYVWYSLFVNFEPAT
jgi:uncharacterized SAM-binding protein YcdF (DUF218 family)